MPLTGLKKDPLQLIIFGGKGGVGKTTCAASAALYLAGEFKTLLISSDPAHSVADSLGLEIGDKITDIKGIKNLSALEISAEKALSNFKMKYKGEIKHILDTSTYLDEDDVESVFSLPVPGMDEVMGFKTIIDLIEENRFDKYVLDTAPTGHALRLLTMPQLLDDWIKVLAKIRWKYRYMVTSFAGKYSPDEGDDLLLSMKKIIKKIEGLLRDRDRCEFIAVTIPESMAITETERLVGTLDKYGIKVRQLVVNNFLESGDCRFCRERKKEQEKHLNSIRNRFSNMDTTVIPLQSGEVRGMESLGNIREALFN